jgi:hypothetical protein
MVLRRPGAKGPQRIELEARAMQALIGTCDNPQMAQAQMSQIVRIAQAFADAMLKSVPAEDDPKAS